MKLPLIISGIKELKKNFIQIFDPILIYIHKIIL